MTIFQIIAIVAMAFCVLILLCSFSKLVRLGAPKDLSEPSGSVKRGVIYSNTLAMLPNHKESAHKHWLSFIAGMLFHAGIFLSLLMLLISFFPCIIQWIVNCCWIQYGIAGILLVTSICGFSLFVKRLFYKSLRSISNLDDYLSNGLTTLFQFFTLLWVLTPGVVAVPVPHLIALWQLLLIPSVCTIHICYYIVVILLLLYMPFGKLKHFLYYLSARYHLGFFYGRRNVWPPKK
jgi:hypothetical protein